MDINRDSMDDYDMVKNIIMLNGGVIDAELRPDGDRARPAYERQYAIPGARRSAR